MKILSLLLLIGICLAGEKYAVLIAGSAEFWNYRHQSDICHAYKTLIKNGFKPENIITFSKDDIAHNLLNRFRGQIYNKPTQQEKGDNVYEGCVIDYRGAEVDPALFLNVLLGNQKAVGEGKKVLKATKDDTVFMYFSDHGAPGLIAFPNEVLYEEDLTYVLNKLAADKAFGKFVFYLEACESGSMFLKLPNNTKIYAVSAADPEEPSYPTYCPPDDMVNGAHVGTCLGDEFSVNFLEDIDKNRPEQSFNEQFATVKQATLKSKVLQWGDLSFASDPIGTILFNKRQELSSPRSYSDWDQKRNSTKWDSRDNKLLFLQNRYEHTKAEIDLANLQEEIDSRNFFDSKFHKLSNLFSLKGDYYRSDNQKCLKQVIDIFQTHCTKLTDYGLKYVKYLNEMCDRSNSVQSTINLAVQSLCLTA